MANKRYLLDTHCLLWFQENNPQIPIGVLDILQQPDNTILFSQVSLFELAIKLKIGKLRDFHATIEDIYNQAIMDSFTYLNIQREHIYKYQQVPLFENHRDPFDRLLIATAMEENAIILSVDEKFKLYKDYIEVIWD